MARKFNDLSSQVFGRLTVVRVSPNRYQNRRMLYVCLCSCGSPEFEVLAQSLRDGNTRSCGCLALEATVRMGKNREKHGLCQTPEYKTWGRIVARCCNPKSLSYPYYGGRGISICPTWRENPEKFIEDMGPRPEGGSLDRIDVNGNYARDNCRWATKLEQAQNKRNNVYLTYNGETKVKAEWLRSLGISGAAFNNRLKSGWTLEEALSAPQGSRLKKLRGYDYTVPDVVPE